MLLTIKMKTSTTLLALLLSSFDVSEGLGGHSSSCTLGDQGIMVQPLSPRTIAQLEKCRSRKIENMEFLEKSRSTSRQKYPKSISPYSKETLGSRSSTETSGGRRLSMSLILQERARQKSIEKFLEEGQGPDSGPGPGVETESDLSPNFTIDETGYFANLTRAYFRTAIRQAGRASSIIEASELKGVGSMQNTFKHSDRSLSPRSPVRYLTSSEGSDDMRPFLVKRLRELG